MIKHVKPVILLMSLVQDQTNSNMVSLLFLLHVLLSDFEASTSSGSNLPSDRTQEKIMKVRNLIRKHPGSPCDFSHCLCLQGKWPIGVTESREPSQRPQAPSSLWIAMPDLILGVEIELCFCRKWQLNHEECYTGTKHLSKLNECFPVRMSSRCVFAFLFCRSLGSEQ